jgi:hypothetical protein
MAPFDFQETIPQLTEGHSELSNSRLEGRQLYSGGARFESRPEHAQGLRGCPHSL